MHFSPPLTIIEKVQERDKVLALEQHTYSTLKLPSKSPERQLSSYIIKPTGKSQATNSKQVLWAMPREGRIQVCFLPSSTPDNLSAGELRKHFLSTYQAPVPVCPSIVYLDKYSGEIGPKFRDEITGQRMSPSTSIVIPHWMASRDIRDRNGRRPKEEGIDCIFYFDKRDPDESQYQFFNVKEFMRFNFVKVRVLPYNEVNARKENYEHSMIDFRPSFKDSYRFQILKDVTLAMPFFRLILLVPDDARPTVVFPFVQFDCRLVGESTMRSFGNETSLQYAPSFDQQGFRDPSLPSGTNIVPNAPRGPRGWQQGRDRERSFEPRSSSPHRSHRDYPEARAVGYRQSQTVSSDINRSLSSRRREESNRKIHDDEVNDNAREEGEIDLDPAESLRRENAKMLEQLEELRFDKRKAELEREKESLLRELTELDAEEERLLRGSSVHASVSRPPSLSRPSRASQSMESSVLPTPPPSIASPGIEKKPFELGPPKRHRASDFLD